MTLSRERFREIEAAANRIPVDETIVANFPPGMLAELVDHARLTIVPERAKCATCEKPATTVGQIIFSCGDAGHGSVEVF